MGRLRTRLRRIGFGLSTVLGARPYGYFIPYRYAAATRAGDAPTYPAAARAMQAAEGEFARVLGLIDGHAAALRAFDGPPPEPRWTQDWFPRLDAAAAYALLREARPARIVEVGSGHSTRFMLRAVRDGGFACEVTAIDPAPRADIAALPLRHLAQTVQQAGRAPFAALRAGDVLFVDSSHILMPGTDVDLLFTGVLPSLPAGVLIHVHDILLPDDYPADWRWRGYNEQSAVAALLGTGRYALRFASHYVATRMAGRLGAAGALPLPPGARETSLWLESL